MIPFFDIGGFLSQQNSDFAKRLILFIAFLPNLAYVLFSQSLYISQSWSIGVEEQFYLIWPVLIKKIKNKELLFYSIIISYVAVKIIAYEVITTFYFLDSTVISLWTLFYATSIDCMAIGGIFALYLFRKDKKLTFLFNRTVQFVTLSILIISLGFGIELPRIHFEFYAILFGIVILNVAGNPRSIINLENRVFNYLGKISYGLYMYQAITIVITLKALMLLGIKNPFVQHFCSLIVTIIIAGLSYRLYESYFINKKIKFSKIVSGDNAASVTVNDKTN